MVINDSFKEAPQRWESTKLWGFTESSSSQSPRAARNTDWDRAGLRVQEDSKAGQGD